MKPLSSLIIVLALAVVPAYSDEAVDRAGADIRVIQTSPPERPLEILAYQPFEGVDQENLYNSGPYQTHFYPQDPYNESWLQTNRGMTIFGWGLQQTAGNRLTDHFTVPPGETWEIQIAEFFAYETNSSAAPTITSINVRIWSGLPGAGGSVIWGDTSTNLFSDAFFTGVYRVRDIDTGSDFERPIMGVDAHVSVFLGPGTYWIDWQMDGDPVLAGPYAPPITIMGQTTTGDALWSLDGGITYAPVVDGGTATPQGFPFWLWGFRRVGNDTCNTAETISCPTGGGTVQVQGSTWNATNTGPYSCNGVQSDWPEVWYRVTGNGGEITASTCNTPDPYLQSKIIVFDGSCSGLNCVAANYGFCGDKAEVTWPSQASTDYYVMVSAIEPVEGGTPDLYDFTLEITCEAACQTLGTPTVTGVGGVACGGTTQETSPVLTWNDIENESGYEWELRDMFGVYMRGGTVGQNVTSVDLGTLLPGPGYMYIARVHAIGDGVNFCDGLWSDMCSFDVAEVPCETLIAPTVTGVGGASCGGTTLETSPIVTWTDVANEDGYRWEVLDLVGGHVANGTTGQDVTSVNVGTLVPGDYIARVQAIGDGVDYCDSEWTTYCSFEVVEVPCEDLPSPAITGVGDATCDGWTLETSPELTWEDISNESGYRWELRDASGAVVGSGTTGQDVTAASLGTLELGNYSARVQARGDGVIYCDGDWSSSCPFEIRVEEGTADFTWWPEQPKQGQKVRFADLSTGEPISWFWEAGDGWTSRDQNPSHTFDASGNFDVSMLCQYQYTSDTRIWPVTVSGAIVCGDEVCEGAETAWSCQADCGLPPESTGRAGGSDRRPVVPAAVGGVGGTGGTFWMTEGWVFNPGDEAVAFVVEYTPLGSTEIMTAGPFDLEAEHGLYWENLVEELFDTTGNGALWLDAPAPLGFLTRSYNTSASGTYGQGVPGIRERLTIGRGDGKVYLIGLLEDSTFRSNLFFQEIDGEWVTLRVELFDENGDSISQRSIDVGGHSNELKSLPSLGAAGHDSVYATVRVVDGDGRAAVIGSVIDAVTGDPTTVDPIHLNEAFLKSGDDHNANDEGHHLVAVVAHTAGAENSVWGTRVVIKGPEGTGTQSVRLVYVPEYDRTGVVGDRLERTVTLREGRQLRWKDVLVDLFELPAGAKTQGALHVYSPSAVLITSRTYNKKVGGGTLGQLIKALAAGDLIDEDNSGTIIGMSHRPGTRTNIGIAVMTNEETEVELRFYSNFPAIRPLGNITRTVDGESHLQVTRVFEELGLSSLPLQSVNAIVRVNRGGAVYVYASSVDNASGDPTTIEATRN